MIQFFIVLVLTGLTVSGASILWPRFTNEPRPMPLEKVHDAVISTGPGKQAESVLGTQSNGGNEPINISTVVSSATGSIVGTIEKSAQQTITGQIVQQLLVQYGKLSPDQQQQIQATICKKTN